MVYWEVEVNGHLTESREDVKDATNIATGAILAGATTVEIRKVEKGKLSDSTMDSLDEIGDVNDQ